MNPPAQSAARPETSGAGQVKETLISVIIAFILAFVFRAFVIEAFIIPTGSMAPTLMGQHERIQSEATGFNWPVGPQETIEQNTARPIQRQVLVHDPMTGQEIIRNNVRTRAGDRILVFKYLYSVYDPKRFDVVVFKAPHEPQTNYIKRLTGLPGEMIALVDGDVFVRPAAGEPANTATNPWALPGWKIQRKPERQQRACWQDVFSSEYQPLTPVRSASGLQFRAPWLGGGAPSATDWKIDGLRDYQYAGSAPTTLVWDNQSLETNGQSRWPINDFCFYNDTGTITRQTTVFAVADLNLRCGIEPASGSVNVSGVVRARGYEFRAEIRGTTATLKMGALGPPGADARPAPPSTWTTLSTGTLARPIDHGRVTNLEFWHADQAVWLFVDGSLVAHGSYDWSPAERVEHVLGVPLDRVMQTYKTGDNILANPGNYPQPGVWWEFDGGPFTLHRVGLQRDIHYQTVNDPKTGRPARATHPTTTVTLGPDQFFVCGDNSPASLDARLWGPPDPWVASEIDQTPGIVPRDLMIGRAFFVYFPSLIRGEWSALPVPDFGRMRWIW